MAGGSRASTLEFTQDEITHIFRNAGIIDDHDVVIAISTQNDVSYSMNDDGGTYPVFHGLSFFVRTLDRYPE